MSADAVTKPVVTTEAHKADANSLSPALRALYDAMILIGHSPAVALMKAKQASADVEANREEEEAQARLSGGTEFAEIPAKVRMEPVTYKVTAKGPDGKDGSTRTVQGWEVVLSDKAGTFYAKTFTENAAYFLQRLKAVDAERTRILKGSHGKDATFTVIRRSH